MQKRNQRSGIRFCGSERPYDGVENPKEPPKRQNLSEHGVPTRVVQNQDLVGGAHNPVSALNNIINVDSGPNPGQVAVDVSGLMSDVDPSRPNGGENGLALSGPNVDMRQITPLIDAWFGRFEVSLPGELSATLKKALDEKSKCDAMSLTTGKSDETLRKIWKNKRFYKSMIDKMSALKQSSQQFDDSLALGFIVSYYDRCIS